MSRFWLLALLAPASLAAQTPPPPRDSARDAARPAPERRTSWISDRRPLRVGDLLTIVVDERVTSAEQNSKRGGLTRKQGGTFDLKSHAVTPIVNLARWGGLVGDVASASTPARLEAAAACGALSERDAATLGEVFVMLQRLRMTHQVGQLAVGHSPGDVITMSELSPLNRSLLNDGLREIAAVQRRVGNFGIPAV